MRYPLATHAGMFLVWRPLPGVRLTDDPTTLGLLREARASMDLPMSRALAGAVVEPGAGSLPHRRCNHILVRIGALGIEAASAGAVLWGPLGLVDDIALPWSDAPPAERLHVPALAPQVPEPFPPGPAWPAPWRNIPPPACWSLRVLLHSLTPLPAPLESWAARPRRLPDRRPRVAFQVWAEYDQSYARTACAFPGLVGGVWLTHYRQWRLDPKCPLARATWQLSERVARDEQPVAFLVLLPDQNPDLRLGLGYMLSWEDGSLRCFADASSLWPAPARRLTAPGGATP